MTGFLIARSGTAVTLYVRGILFGNSVWIFVSQLFVLVHIILYPHNLFQIFSASIDLFVLFLVLLVD